eukprot:365535-Chlamydomonas_euryale.AAC.14
MLSLHAQVLLFPGGAREVVKRVGQEYTLMWKDTPDFVRLAAKCGALIVPFAAVGADDAYDVMMETDEQLAMPVLGNALRSALSRVGPELNPVESVMPLTRLPLLGLPSPVPVPNLTRLYFKFGEPLDTATLGLDLKDGAACQRVYDGIREGIEADLRELQELRAGDAERELPARLGGAIAAPLALLAHRFGFGLGQPPAGKR